MVIVASAITRANVPASVDRSPPLYVPRESLDDITLESSDRLTPVMIPQHIINNILGYISVMLFVMFNEILPSSTSAATNMMSPEQTYCGTEYGTINWKLKSIPRKTTISDASNICLPRDRSE